MGATAQYLGLVGGLGASSWRVGGLVGKEGRGGKGSQSPHEASPASLMAQSIHTQASVVPQERGHQLAKVPLQ